MKEHVNSQYRFATFCAMLSLVAYGLMRYIEGNAFGAWTEHASLSFYLSVATAALVLAEHLVLRAYSFAPLVIVTTMTLTMTIGAYFTTNWNYYHLASLGMVGIMCLYGQIRSLILYQFLNIAVNFCVFFILPEDAPDGFATHMVMSFLLYLFSAFFLIVLFYRANKKETIAQSGLQAFSALLGSTPNLMVIVDGRRRVRYISARMCAFAEIDEAAAIGRPLVDLFRTESLKLMFADILDADDFYSATREIDMDNEPHYYKIIADRLSGTDAGMFIEITDMTEIVLASMEAEKSRKEAEAANKSKSAFLTTMSHEIRTPMNAIIGISEILLARKELPSDIAQACSQIHTSGHGLLGIINDILDLSKIETGKLDLTPTRYDLPSFINDTVQLNIVRIGSKPIEFSLDLADALPMRMIGDELRLKQILNNVLSNAFKYTDAGRVALSISHRAAEDGVYLTFKVSDTGQGMRQEDLTRLFDAYTRFNEAENRYTEGTGLGLNITRKLVEMMGGSIDVESEYGKGSTFTITVLQQPSGDASVIDAALAEQLCNFSYAIEGRNAIVQLDHAHMPYGSVLIVDDVETNLYVARGLLAPYGLTIDTASSGFEAIEKLSGGAVYDIVFMDHMMPKMNGIETTEKLRGSGYTGTIVALTANAIVGNDKFFIAHGFDDFLSKPIDVRQLDTLLNRYIRDRQSPETLQRADAAAPRGGARTAEDTGLMRLFRRDAERAIAALTDAMHGGDDTLLAITAHAVKSALANIGEHRLSELARALEAAGNAGDRAFTAAHAPELIEALQGIIRNIEPVSDAAAEDDTKLLVEVLVQFQAACAQYDGGAARACLKRLGESAWRAETSAVLDELSKLVLGSEFEEAAARAATLCG